MDASETGNYLTEVVTQSHGVLHVSNEPIPPDRVVYRFRVNREDVGQFAFPTQLDAVKVLECLRGRARSVQITKVKC